MKVGAGKVSNLQKETKTHGTPSALVAKITYLQESISVKDKALEEANAYAIESSSQLVTAQKTLKEE